MPRLGRRDRGPGSALLEALSHRWGMVREAGSNKVWFELVLEMAGMRAGSLAGAR